MSLFLFPEINLSKLLPSSRSQLQTATKMFVRIHEKISSLLLAIAGTGLLLGVTVMMITKSLVLLLPCIISGLLFGVNVIFVQNQQEVIKTNSLETNEA